MNHRQTVRIKICGIRTPEALGAVVEGGADFAGFVHWRGSSRYIGIQDARELAAPLPPATRPVSLFVDETPQRMLESPFEWIQLHGDEDEETCRLLRREGRRVIRGFKYDPGGLERWNACPDVELLLVDGSEVGGSGRSFDHQALSERLDDIGKPVIVAGGLDERNVGGLLASVPCWGVDVSSGVESSPGEKDPSRITSFCREVRSH